MTVTVLVVRYNREILLYPLNSNLTEGIVDTDSSYYTLTNSLSLCFMAEVIN